MNGLLRLARGAAIGVLSVWTIEYVVRRTIAHALMVSQNEETTSEAGRMKAFSIHNIDLSYLDWSEYVFERKGKSTYVYAIQITQDNIGALSVEFESEIFRVGVNSLTFTANVLRSDKSVFHKSFELHDWLVIKDGLFVTFPDAVFRKTFTLAVQGIDYSDINGAENSETQPKSLDKLAPLNRHGTLQDTFDQVREEMGMPPIGGFRAPYQNEPGSSAAAKQEGI